MMQCARCGQKFRIATTGGTVHVTCPKCTAQWDWPEAGASGATPEEVSNARANEAWRAVVLQPRLSYAAAAAVLVAGLFLGVYWERFQQRLQQSPVTEEDVSDSLELTNAAPAVQSHGKTSAASGPRATNEVPSVERLLPSNGVDFNPPNPVGTNF